MKINVNGFDDTFKIVFSIFVETFMKLFYIMDLLKIFRMQEPVPKDLLSKNPEVGKYREVVQEKDTLLRNCKARIRELEQQVAELETKNELGLPAQMNPQCSTYLIKEYEAFYQKIMIDSEEIVNQKNAIESKLKEMETFCRDIMEKYDKAKKVIDQYEESQAKSKSQLQKYQEIINSLTEEYNKLKEGAQLFETESKLNVKQQQQGKLKELLLKNQLEKECCKSMFEPLKSLDK